MNAPVAGPADWRGPGTEPHGPVLVAIAVAALLQLVTPSVVDARVDLAVFVLMLVALFAVVAAEREDEMPFTTRISGHSRVARRASRALVALLSLANLGTGLVLTARILGRSSDLDAFELLVDTASVWVTNVIVFALWYWEADRGGPGRRAEGTGPAAPDFLFPQMSDPSVASEGWRPYFFDYLYLSFSNAASFAAADALPMSRWAKAAMLSQSALSLSLLLLVLSRVAGLLS